MYKVWDYDYLGFLYPPTPLWEHSKLELEAKSLFPDSHIEILY